jgi:chloramphenicol O-acetyltransferase type A
MNPMKTKIDMQNWSRRDYYRYFGGFDDPFFGVVVNVDCTAAYTYCKKHDLSFFLYYMYESAKAVNMVENFRYRLVDGDIYLYDRVHPSTTVGRKDNTFGFALFEYTDTFETFAANAKEKIGEVQTYPGLRIEENASRVDVVHCTTIPWFSFTGAKHEKSIRCGESIPKFAYGKFFVQDGKKLMPVSINANHGLVDGYHVARYMELFQEGLNKDS